MTTNTEPRKTQLSTHVFYLALLMIVSGYALGLTGREPDRPGFFQRIGSWLGIAGLFFEPPPEEVPACPEQIKCFQSLPEELVNQETVREMGSDGHPAIDHSAGW